jgi:hypothetical protein
VPSWRVRSCHPLGDSLEFFREGSCRQRDSLRLFAPSPVFLARGTHAKRNRLMSPTGPAIAGAGAGNISGMAGATSGPDFLGEVSPTAFQKNAPHSAIATGQSNGK